MGKATITGGGTDGLYTITRTFDNTRIDALIGKLTTKITTLQSTEIPDAGQAVADAIDAGNALLAQLDAAVAAMNAGAKNQKQVDDLTKQVVTARLAVDNAQVRLDMKRAELASAQTEKANMEKSRGVADSRDAWCADLTEDLSGEVGTIEPRGEGSTDPIIVPGYTSAAWDKTRDGQLVVPYSSGPPAVFWNWAAMPAWQKWKPTYRVGKITNIVADTADVELDDIRSTQQQLAINQTPTLTGVPVEYMSCNGAAFAVNDRVIVRFEGQDWSQPKVIGFESNPKPCAGWFERFSGVLWSLDTADDPTGWPAEVKDVTGPWNPVSAAMTDATWRMTMYGQATPGGTRTRPGMLTASGHKAYMNPAHVVWEEGGLRLLMWDSTNNYVGTATVTLIPGDAAHLLKPDGTNSGDNLVAAAWKRLEIEYTVSPPLYPSAGWAASIAAQLTGANYNPHPILQAFLVSATPSSVLSFFYSGGMTPVAWDGSNAVPTALMVTDWSWDPDWAMEQDPGGFTWPRYAHNGAEHIPGDLAWQAIYDAQFWPVGQERTVALMEPQVRKIVVDRDKRPYLSIPNTVAAIVLRLNGEWMMDAVIRSVKLIY
jgi:hypothetical protein